MFSTWLKRFEVVRSLNRKLKSYQVISNYRRTVRHYSPLSEMPISDTWRIRAQALSRLAKRSDLKIFFVGTDEQQDSTGFLQALERLGDVRCFYRKDGGWGQADPTPYAQRREKNTKRLEELFVINASEGWIPHLLIAQTWACLIEPACFSRLRDRYGVFIANVAMDDRHQYLGSKVRGNWDGTFPLIPHIDLTLTAAPEAVAWYRKEGGAALYFPEASDPEIFRPMPDLPKVHDVSFVGVRYGIREKIVAALRKAGIKVTAHGDGWEAGRISSDDVPKFFAQSRIILGVGTIGHCDDFYALKLRDFDAPMSGSCYLTSDNPDLTSLYQRGNEIVTYSTINDAVEIAKDLLANDAKRDEIAQAGRARALRDHTWDHRFSKLFDLLLEQTGGQCGFMPQQRT